MELVLHLELAFHLRRKEGKQPLLQQPLPHVGGECEVRDKYVRRMLAATIPLVFVLVLLGVAVRDRQLDPTVAGGLIAILGSIVALFATREDSDDKSKKG